MTLNEFIRQKSYEHINAKIRRHPITLVPYFFGFLVLLAMPVALYWLTARLFPDSLTNPIAYPILVLVASIFVLSSALFFYTYFVTFYLDLMVITNDRLVHIEQQGLFARTISELDLYKIQDATSEVKGIFPSIFGYGNLLIQTAATTEEFKFENIPHPESLRQTIMNLAEEDRKYHNAAAPLPTTT